VSAQPPEPGRSCRLHNLSWRGMIGGGMIAA
jgi:hypothetical protein